MKIIDIHTHGIGGYDTVTTSADEILKIADIHGSHGVSKIIPAIYPSSIESMRNNMLAVKNAMAKQQKTGYKSARIVGVYLEGPFLNPKKCGALDKGSFLKPDTNDLRQLVDGFEDIVKVITIAPELEGASAMIRQIADMGIIASMGHSNATYAEAEVGFNAGAKGITHLFNAMRGIHHREPGLAGFGLMNREVYIEVIADPFHLDSGLIKYIFSTIDPGRIILISDTVKAAKKEDASIDIRNESNALMGGSMTIRESSMRLIEIGIDQEIVNRAVSENPGRYLKYRG